MSSQFEEHLRQQEAILEQMRWASNNEALMREVLSIPEVSTGLAGRVRVFCQWLQVPPGLVSEVQGSLIEAIGVGIRYGSGVRTNVPDVFLEALDEDS